MGDVVKSLLKFVGFLVLVAVIGLGVLFALYMKVAQIDHNGMAPTILPDESVLLWKTTRFDVGDIAFCHHPRDDGRYVIGRVVGEIGDNIEILRGGTLTINSEQMARDFHSSLEFVQRERGQNTTYTVAWGTENLRGHEHEFFDRVRRNPSMRRRAVTRGYFLLSDNRGYRNEDSRIFGEVRGAECIGRVFMRLTQRPLNPEIPHRLLEIL